MPYIGTQPTKVVSRQSANVYRYIATAGQTAFTGADLGNNVLACNPADMIVHMNGLRLESTDYTATSTTVTLTTAATAGDEVTITSFETFEVANTYDKATADTRYVNTTGDTMTGALALPTGGLTVGTDQLAVDSAGRVTMPYQPSFTASPASAYNPATGAGQQFLLGAVLTNIGNHFNSSNSRFTAPVSGRYLIGFNAYWNPASYGSYIGAYISSNSAGIHYSFSSVGSDVNTPLSVPLYLNANDYVDYYTYSSSSSNRLQPMSTAYAYLVG